MQNGDSLAGELQLSSDVQAASKQRLQETLNDSFLRIYKTHYGL